MNQTIRIIGGQFRGKKLTFPTVEGLRPTPDRVRETLFNWLMHDIRDANCLDAFAGSGALGFEAFSRGAANVTFLEKDLLAYTNLLKIATSFNSTKLTISKTDSCDYLQQTKAQFDIVFLDPPFAKNFIPGCLELLATNPVLIKGGLVYIESPKKIAIDHERWQQQKLKEAGQIVYGLYKKNLSKVSINLGDILPKLRSVDQCLDTAVSRHFRGFMRINRQHSIIICLTNKSYLLDKLPCSCFNQYNTH